MRLFHYIALVAGIALIFIGGTLYPKKPPTLAEQWGDAYRACVGTDESFSTPEVRAACIAAADRVMACAGQKEGKHE